MTNGNGTLKTILCGVAVAGIAALMIAVGTMLGTVRVNAAAIARVTPHVERNTATISDIRGDVQEIKAIVQRIEGNMEAK